MDAKPTIVPYKSQQQPHLHACDNGIHHSGDHRQVPWLLVTIRWPEIRRCSQRIGCDLEGACRRMGTDPRLGAAEAGTSKGNKARRYCRHRMFKSTQLVHSAGEQLGQAVLGMHQTSTRCPLVTHLQTHSRPSPTQCMLVRTVLRPRYLVRNSFCLKGLWVKHACMSEHALRS